ncbi:MAG: XRE family transcriptional regulator [Magnetococcales bacterium]|nr:XRE family transcriptional regulator [Magnetococcales bacterium]
MLLKGITGRDIALATGIASSHVSATIHGRKNLCLVLQHLLLCGCPAKLLAIPERVMRRMADQFMLD